MLSRHRANMRRMSAEPSGPIKQRDSEIVALEQRIASLERENQRVRERLEAVTGSVFPPDNPNFHPLEFMKALRRAMLVLMVPIYFVAPVILLGQWLAPNVARAHIGPVRVVDMGGGRTQHPRPGRGVFAVGGAAFGAVAVGGFGMGVFAFGGGAIGIVAVGGGAIGVIAIGGGSVGFIAIGGSAVGYFAMGRRAAGRYVLAFNRQDPEAVEFFRRWVPGIQRAVTNPMPVLPVNGPTVAAAASA
jgi:hypothetical protein